MGSEQVEQKQYYRAQSSRRSSTFRPGWLPSLVVLLLFPGLLWLGFWQLERAAEKQRLQSLYEARQQAAPVSLSDLLGESDLAYRRVRIQGYFEPKQSILLDNRTRDGRAGVEWVQPFFDRLSGQWLLLNRGWQIWPDRRVQPVVQTPTEELNLYAWIYVPLSEPVRFGRWGNQQGWPRLVAVLEPAELWPQLGKTGFAHELRLDPGQAALQGGWPVIATSAAKHQGYAAQWFAMAVALLGLFIYLGIHNGRENNNEPSAEHCV